MPRRPSRGVRLEGIMPGGYSDRHHSTSERCSTPFAVVIIVRGNVIPNTRTIVLRMRLTDIEDFIREIATPNSLE